MKKMKKSRRAKKVSSSVIASSAKRKFERPPKFNLSDWVVMITIILLLLGGLITGAYFGIVNYIQKQSSEISLIDEDILDFDGFLFNRGSEILDIYANKKSAVIVFTDSLCLSDETCAEYLDVILSLTNMMRDDAPETLIFNTDSARSRDDTNVDSALSRAKITKFPSLILVRDGIETSRYVGSDVEADAPYDLFMGNNLIDEDLLEELLSDEEE